MTSFTNQIQTAREQGYTDDEIYNHVKTMDIYKIAQKEGYNEEEIKKYLFETSSKENEKSLFQKFSDFGDRQAVNLASSIESVPRNITETPQNILELIPSLGGFRALEREAEEEGLPKPFNPIDFVADLIPQNFKDKFQSFKEFFPTFEEARQNIQKAFPEERQESLNDRLPGEDLLNKGEEFLINSLFFGARNLKPLIGSVAAGAASEAAKKLELSPELQLWSTIIAGGAPELGRGILKSVNKAATNPQEFALKAIRPRLKNLDLEMIEIAKKENINPSLASVSKGGITQFGQNTLSQNFLTKSFFDDLAKNTSNEITNALENKINTLNGKDFQKLKKATEQQLGTVPFSNPAKKLVNSLAEEPMTKFNSGQNVQERLNAISDISKEKANVLFENLKSSPELNKIQLKPVSSLRRTVELIKQKAKAPVKASETSALVGELKRFKEAFKKGMTVDRAIAQVEELNKLIDFSETIGNQSKTLVPIRSSLIDDISNSLKQSGRGDLFKLWGEARSNYAEYAQAFGKDNRVVYDALRTQKPESIIQKGNTKSGMKSYLKAFSQSGENIEADFSQLQRSVIEDIYKENLIDAETLQNFKLTDNQISKLNELKSVLPQDIQLLIDESISTSKIVKKGIKTTQELEAIRADIANSTGKGELPVQTLKIMRTPEGLEKVRKSLEKTKFSEGYLSALEKQVTRDIIFDNAINELTQDVNPLKIRQNLKNPRNRKVLENILGEQTFSEMESIGKFIDKAVEGDRAFKNFSQTATTQQNTAIFQNILKGGGMILAGKLFSLGKLGAGIGAIYAFGKLYTNPRFINQMLKTVKIGATAAKTPVNFRLYQNAITDTIKIIREVLPKEDQDIILTPSQN